MSNPSNTTEGCPARRPYHAPLTDGDAFAIRRSYASSGITQAELAERFGVSQGDVSRIATGRTFRHVGGPRTFRKPRRRNAPTPAGCGGPGLEGACDAYRDLTARDILRSILGKEAEVPRKYQNPKLQIRNDVSRPYYFIRISVPVITEAGIRPERQRKPLGFCDEITAKQAKQERAKVLEVVNSGRVLITSQIRFKAVAERFLEVRVPQLGYATQNKYRTQIENHILPAFGDLRLCDIDRPTVEAWLTEKEKAGLGWWSRIDLKGVLSAIFTAAADWKMWEGDNPTKSVRIGKKRPVREKRLLTVEDLQAILAAVRERERFLVLILVGTGLRISEALGLRWSDVDLEAGTLTVRRRWYRGDISDEGETKTDASRREAQLGPLVEEFRRRYSGPEADGRFVFVGDDGKNPPDDRDILRYEFRPILKRLNLYYPGFGWHAFRRQNITMRQQVGGATPMEAQRAAGHASLDMTYLYTLADKTREREQVTAIMEKLSGDPGQKGSGPKVARWPGGYEA